MEHDYDKDIVINKHALDEEWLTQPQKMLTYSKLHAQAIHDKNRAEDLLEVKRGDLKKAYAKLDEVARATPPPPGLAKQTDEAVKQWILRQPQYLEAQDEVYKAMSDLTDKKYEMDILFGAVMAFQGRKTALEELDHLFGMGYFSQPRSQQGQEKMASASQLATERAIMRNAEAGQGQPESAAPTPPPAMAPIPKRPTPKA